MFLNQENQPKPASSCDAEMVARAQRGEEKAFEALFHIHKQRVYSLCLRMTGNAGEAEELTQEAFLQVFRKIHTFRGDSAFSTWLHRLSVNIVLMRWRKKTVSETPIENIGGGKEFDEQPREYGAPDLTLTASIDRLNLERAVAQLPPGYKQIFVLHDVEGYQHNEIAAMLGTSIGNSKSQLHKARMRLRKLLRSGMRKDARSRKAPGMAGSAQFLSESHPAYDGSPAAQREFATVAEGKC
jgi:RNA polymerase sigma-70 factor (ECF subfamily)